MSAGRGKAVIVLHCVGDKLWESGSKEALPQLGPVEGLSPADHENEEKEAVDDEAASTGKEDASDDDDDEENDHVDEVEEQVEGLSLDQEEQDPRSPEEIMDEIVENA